jgi:hypothetical protein
MQAPQDFQVSTPMTSHQSTLELKDGMTLASHLDSWAQGLREHALGLFQGGLMVLRAGFPDEVAVAGLVVVSFSVLVIGSNRQRKQCFFHERSGMLQAGQAAAGTSEGMRNRYRKQSLPAE